MSNKKINSGLLSKMIKGVSKNSQKNEDVLVSRHSLPKSVGDTLRVEKDTGNVKADSLEKVLKSCHVNKGVWDVKDFNVKELANGNFLWTVHFKKGRSTVDFEEIKKELKSYSPKVPKINYSNQNKNLLLEVAIYDSHIGKKTPNYDLKSSCELFGKAVDYAISSAKAFNVEKVVFPIGQDFLHVDSRSNMTTAGTPQDVDGFANEIFVSGRKLLVQSIEKLKTLAPVDVISIPGNHEENSMFHLADCIECRYHNDENVTVDNKPINRKYYQWGKTLIGYAHGDKNKINDLALLMASEAPKSWSQTNYRYWKLGHFHHQKMLVDEKAGVVMEILPSLSDSDYWHTNKGYVNNVRGAVFSIYDKENGLVTKFYFNV